MRAILISVLFLVLAFAAAQLVRPNRTNPPTDASRTIRGEAGSGLVSVLDRSCRDCHSNQTVWPSYTRVAPVSWLMAYAVSEGRKAVNESWQGLVAASPRAAEFMTMLFRMFGAYIVAFCIMAIGVAARPFRRGESWAWWALLVGNTIAFLIPMTYDWIVDAIGPFEMTEYLGIAVIYLALAFTASFTAAGRDEGVADYSRRKPADRLV